MPLFDFLTDRNGEFATNADQIERQQQSAQVILAHEGRRFEQDTAAIPATPVHDNIRGADYYAAHEEDPC